MNTNLQGTKYHYHQSEPQPVNTDLPNLRHSDEWSVKDGSTKSRMEMYLGWLKALGMTNADAQCMMSDLYWDCYNELIASGVVREQLKEK